MPGPEAVVHLHSWAELGIVGGGFAGMAASAYLGLSKLATKFEAYKESNDQAHVRIEKGIERINGQTDENTKDIARIEGVCHERHKGE